MGCADELRARIRAQYGDGIPVSGAYRAPSPATAVAHRPHTAEDDARLEKAIVKDADDQMRALGFEVISIGQAGSAKGTKQTPGVADRRYYHRGRRLAFWWEAKATRGAQRPDQRLFQELVEACGETYVLGTDQELFAWLLARYPVRWDESGHLVWCTTPIPERSA